MTRRPFRLSLIAAAVAALSLSGCTSAAQSDKVQVVAGLYPLAFVAEAVGGDRVEVTNLTPPAGHPHELELTAQQVASVSGADLVLYISNLQPALDEAVALSEAPGSVLDALTVVTDSSSIDDPHLWLDPKELSVLAAETASRLAQVDPDGAATYTANAESLQSQLTALDGEYTAATASCTSRTLIVGHLAYGYLAKAYNFELVAVSGLSPESEPSPSRLAEVVALVQQLGATTVYAESALDTKVADTIAAETGAQVSVLSPLESISGADQDYFSVMRDNLAALRIGQGCA